MNSDLKNDWQLFLDDLRTSGFREAVVDTWDYLRAKFDDRADRFDETFGINTTGLIRATELDGVGAHQDEAYHYWPTRKVDFEQVMSALGDLDHRNYTFVDLGSGKGRVVLLAAALPFKKVIGVESSPILVDQAKKNAAAYSGPIRCAEVEFALADAAEFTPPDGGDLVVYLFDPFGPRVLAKVLENLKPRAGRPERNVFLLYYSPTHDDVVRAAGFELTTRGNGENWPWHVYTAPRAESGRRAGDLR